MLFGFPYKKVKLEVSKVLLVGLVIDELDGVIDQYHWDECPDDMNLCYYDSLVMFLDSLDGAELREDFFQHTKLTAEKFGRYLFKGSYELIAIGNPTRSYEVGGHTFSACWWLPVKPEVSSVTRSQVETQKNSLEKLLKCVQSSDWTIREFSSLYDNLKEFCRKIHPKADTLGITGQKVLAKHPNGDAAALRFIFNAFNKPNLAWSKNSCKVFLLPSPQEMSCENFFRKLLEIRYPSVLAETVRPYNFKGRTRWV